MRDENLFGLGQLRIDRLGPAQIQVAINKIPGSRRTYTISSQCPKRDRYRVCFIRSLRRHYFPA